MADEESNKKNPPRELDGKIIEVEIGKLICFKSNGKKFSKDPKNSCQIFRGKFENKTNVFIRRFDAARLPSVDKKDEELEWKKKQFIRDMELLRVPERTSHMHENFTRYFCWEVNKNFYYVAIEWCICSVEDLYVSGRKGYTWEGEEIVTDLIKASLGEKEILRQATKGVAFLHAMGFVHRNLKPSNFLIAQIDLGVIENGTRLFKYVVKVSDFRMSKDIVKEPGHSGQRGSGGWISPDPSKTNGANNETHPANNVTDIIKTRRSEDVFILGCFFHYVLTDGVHPFGYGVNREININDSNDPVYGDSWKPQKIEEQAVSLLKDMLKFNRKERPKLKTILDRAYFLPDDYYKLYDLPGIKPGLCVIFNQENFDNEKNNRYGTEKDLADLSKVFEDFGFEVEIHKDLKAQELCDKIKDLGERDFSMYACLVVCILSHGGEGTVCGTEQVDQEVSIEAAKAQFNKFKCPTLNGKPKIWIIQACQGNLEQEDWEKSTPLLEPKRTKTSPTTRKKRLNADSVSLGNQLEIQCQLPPDIPRPPVSDILDIRATVPGFVSYRNPVAGSILIQNLCKQLRVTFLNEGEKSTRHLEDVLKMVQKSIIEEPFFPATEDDNTKLKNMKNPINYSKDLENVTDEDVQKYSNIDVECKKYFVKETNELIFFRPYDVKQTIEWRSTLMNFIRFEKK